MSSTNISLPRLYEVVGFDHHRRPNGFQRISSPPDLLHDSEEDDGDSLSTSPPLHHQHDFDLAAHHRRKSVPHKSPSAIHDAFQASAIDKSVVFQWDASAFHPPYPVHPAHHLVSPDAHHQQRFSQQHAQQQQQQHQHSPPPSMSDDDLFDDEMRQLPPLKSKVICGESLISALRHRVAKARQIDPLPLKKRHIHTPRRQLTATCISLPPLHQQNSHSPRITKKKMAISVPQHQQQVSQPQHLSSPPSSASSSPQFSASLPSTSPSPPAMPRAKQQQQPRARKTNANGQVRHGSSGRPCRVKGPCQACRETSDGCMRKAFDWPFPSNQQQSDKGKLFVYLCNKCGLRYNKSGGCVCRSCRWVFCKEEKRKAMQYIDEMRKKRPDGHVDMDEDIEGFVCTPKYWSCGRPWKVGWVLNDHQQHEEHDDDNSSSCDSV
ncbi:hypothetical protein BC940DRAFT_301911 [Gongronella butleri]|nr:hypothetical protein BC940DRAFT_301911 [Gongronella butleri]